MPRKKPRYPFFFSSPLLLHLLICHEQKDVVGKLRDLAPQNALVFLRGDWEVSKPETLLVELLERGDVIQVLPGERLPTDGTVVFGTSTVNESILTGESMPVLKTKVISRICCLQKFPSTVGIFIAVASFRSRESFAPLSVLCSLSRVSLGLSCLWRLSQC